MPELTALERFLLDYVENVGGEWDQVEPQVYEVLLPAQVGTALDLPAEDHLLRFAFDPEAVQDDSSAQLMIFGNPLLDRLFEDARARGQRARTYCTSLNLAVHGLSDHLRRSLTVPPEVAVECGPPRIYYFAHAVFWFEATFLSDEKEQESYAVAIDLYYRRMARHLLPVLETMMLVDERPLPYPDAPRQPLAEAYCQALADLRGTLTGIIHTRQAELTDRIEREVRRMTQYFAEMRVELQERRERARAQERDTTQYDEQERALRREEQTRLAELRQHAVLRVHLRLTNLLELIQPKLQTELTLRPKEGLAAPLTLVWDPLAERVEPAPCPICQRPSLSFVPTRNGQVRCPDCTTASPPTPRGRG